MIAARNALIANVLLAAVLAAVIGGLVALEIPAGLALLIAAGVFVAIKVDDARIRRNRRRVAA